MWITVRAREHRPGSCSSTIKTSATTNPGDRARFGDGVRALFQSPDPVGQTGRLWVDCPSPWWACSTPSAHPRRRRRSPDPDDTAVVPITTAAEEISGGTSRNSVSSIIVQSRSSADLSAAYQEANHELLALHGITTTLTTPTSPSRRKQSVLSTATSVDRTLTILLGGVAAISSWSVRASAVA